MDALFLALIEQIVKALELRVIDYERGGFLPIEKRGLAAHSQDRIGWLVSKLARVKVLDQQEMLRNKLLVLASVFKNDYPELSEAYFSSGYQPKRG